MPRIVALEWDAREIRVVAANARAGDLSVEQIFSVPLAAGDAAPGDVAVVAAEITKQHHLSKAPALVALSRAQVDLKPLTLPPAPDDELPDMVRLQAMREFTSLGEDWPLDFLPLSAEADQPREVLAAAVSPEMVERISQVCQAAGLETSRVVLRPMATASLFARTSQASQHAVRLLVDLLPTEADLTVVVDRRVVFTRTARLGGDVLAGPEEVKPLVGEIRRTLAAVHSQLQNRRVEAIYLCGSSPAHATLAARMQEELNLPARTVDLLAPVELGRAKLALPERAERFAALLGLLLDEAQSVGPALDFLHTRKPPPPPSRKRTYALAAAAASSLVLLVALVIYWQIRTLDKRIAELRKTTGHYAQLDQKIKDAENKLAPFEDWAASDYVLPNELVTLSEKLPKSNEIMFTNLEFRAREDVGRTLRAKAKQAKTPSGAPRKEEPVLLGADMPVTGLARDVKVLEKWEQQHPEAHVKQTKDGEQHPLFTVPFTGAMHFAPAKPDYRPAIKPGEAKAVAAVPRGNEANGVQKP
jgi:Tfp pilus assembly PilM family ATPase